MQDFDRGASNAPVKELITEDIVVESLNRLVKSQNDSRIYREIDSNATTVPPSWMDLFSNSEDCQIFACDVSCQTDLEFEKLILNHKNIYMWFNLMPGEAQTNFSFQT